MTDTSAPLLPTTPPTPTTPATPATPVAADSALPGIILEAGKLFRLALPLMGAQVAMMGMGVADVVMAGRYSSIDLAGVALGSSIFWPTLMLLMGLINAVTPIVSQQHGAKKYTEIGATIRQGLWLALIGGLTGMLVLNNIAPVYLWLDVDPAASSVSIPYLKYCSLGMPALMCFFCLRFLAEGMGYTRPALYIATSALLLKVPLNYIFIYGKFGLPEMGGAGCGLAQAIVMWLQLLLVVIVVTRQRFHITGWLSQFSLPNWQIIKPLLVIGIPIGTTLFAELGLFSFTTLLLGRFGAEVVAAHNIAMSITAVMFMLPLALGMSAAIRIGHRVGSGEIVEARTSAGIVMGFSLIVAIAGSLSMYFFRTQMVNLYTRETAVYELSIVLLLFAVFFFIFDAIQGTAVGTLRGYKDTRIPLFIALFSYWLVGLPIGASLGLGWFGKAMGVYGFWVGLASGVGCAALLLGIRLTRLSANVALVQELASTGEHRTRRKATRPPSFSSS